jgi:hypothetical protein
MMDYQNKEHAELVMNTFKSLPDINLTDRELYDELIKTLNKYNGKIGNGEVLATLKLIIMQLCEHCACFIEEQKYEELQEKYK